jgi:hypothetical protein
MIFFLKNMAMIPKISGQSDQPPFYGRTRGKLHFVCFGEKTWNCMHFLVILSLKTLWAGVKHWSTALHRLYVYRKPIDHLHDLAIWKWFKNVYISFDLKSICVWCLDNWSRILSGKPFNTFSMAKLKTLQFRLTLTPLFTATHAFFSSLSPFFFMICDWGSPSFLCRRIFFILVTLDLCLLLIHRDMWNSQKWQISISNLQALS